VKCVVAQIYKAIKLAIYNIINRNQRLAEPETPLIQLLCTTAKNFMPSKLPCRQRLPLLRIVKGVRFEWNASTFGNLQYDDGGSALSIKRLVLALM